MSGRFQPATPELLRAWARLWREMHARGTPKQRADAEAQARHNEARAATR